MLSGCAKGPQGEGAEPATRPLEERTRRLVWAEQANLQARAVARQAAGIDVPVGWAEVGFEHLVERYRLTDEELRAIDVEGREERWLEGRECAPPNAPIVQHALVLAPEPWHKLVPAPRSPCIPGTVILTAVIGTDGVPTDVRMLRGIDPASNREALRTVEEARFLPALLCGRPVAVHFNLSIAFHCPPADS